MRIFKTKEEMQKNILDTTSEYTKTKLKRMKKSELIIILRQKLKRSVFISERRTKLYMLQPKFNRFIKSIVKKYSSEKVVVPKLTELKMRKSYSISIANMPGEIKYKLMKDENNIFFVDIKTKSSTDKLFEQKQKTCLMINKL